MDLSGPCPGLAMTVMTLLPSLEEILRPPKLFWPPPLPPSTKEVVRGRLLLMMREEGAETGKTLRDN